MRKLLCILVFLLLFCVSGVQGYNIAHRFGCDTLIMRGNRSQLKELENVILEEISKVKAPGKKAGLYALMGETQVALGNYKKAGEWYTKGCKAYDAIDFSVDSNKVERYYRALCYYDFASVRSMMGEETGEVMDSFGLCMDLIMEWVEDYGSSANEARMSYGGALLNMIIANVTLLGRDYTGALDYCKKYIADLEMMFPDGLHKSKEYVSALCMMADIYQRGNNYERALEYFQQALVVMKNICGGNSTYFAMILDRIGGIYYSLNDLAESAEFFKSGAEVMRKAGFSEHTELAVSYSGLGMVMLNNGKYKESYEYFLKANAMQKKLCGKDSYREVTTRLYTAYPLVYIGQYKQAMDIVAEVSEAKSLNENITSDDYLNCIDLGFSIQLLDGLYDEVVFLYKDVLGFIDALENVSANTERNLHLNAGRAYKRKGDYRNAIEPYGKVLEFQRNIAHDNFSFLTEEQRSGLWKVDETRVRSVFAINMADEEKAPGVGGLLYDMALLNKGILLQASINLAEVVDRSGDVRLKEMFSDFRMLKQTLDARGKEETAESKKMEGEIVKRARQYGDFMEYANITWQDVQAALGEDDVAIEFVSATYAGQCTYSAEVIRKDMAVPAHIKLFTVPADQVGSLYAQAGEYSAMAAEKIWSKRLRSFMKKGGNVFFVPDGELYNIGVEYIPISKGRRMCDEYNMCRLSSTREIVTRRESVGSNTCALYGGLNYNTSLQDMELYAYASTIRGGKTFNFTSDRSSGHSSWGYLPGTAEEVSSIGSTLQQGNYQVSTFTGSEGVEESFKALSGQKTKIIHIATHGFYLPQKGDPLQNSGLVFAGANNFWNASSQEADFDDGILTAKEISHLNLQGTDLVVMSACQTGLGKVTGEGVFGLQRAFKKAGVQTLLMSLWEVDDDATQLMMSEFYKALSQGKGKRESLEHAQAQVRQCTFTRNGKKVSGNDPFYWAAFIMMD
ncbi:MAG: CHAT domain-containing protein [Bacteroidales bacterium]|nr:CHAT domain-containing protein [Bacteroidales bacterium]